LSDEALEGMHAVMLPPPDLENISEVEAMMRMANNSAMGRDALTKFVLSAEYVAKLVPLVKMAEDKEDVLSLHKLCNIMKTLILLNDTAIIETVVMDELVLGVVGALECMRFADKP
jgi:protein phosphatase 4 regulatory subunit 3